MLEHLNFYFSNRKNWLLLTLSALILELLIIYLQYKKLMYPCVLCIYQRCALLGIMLASFLNFILPIKLITLCIGTIICFYSALKGLLFSLKQFSITQQNSLLLNNCYLNINFPDWLPLNKWLPFIFDFNNDCNSHQFNILHLHISQWMAFIFAIYLILAIIIVLTLILIFLKNRIMNFCAK